jgi:hypothetical protein
MIGKDLSTVDCQPERSRTDIEKSRSIGEVDPGLLFVWLMAWDAVMAAQGSYSLASPTVAASGKVTVAVDTLAIISSLAMRANTVIASINSRDVCVLH